MSQRYFCVCVQAECEATLFSFFSRGRERLKKKYF
jgi:hypothetical protein